MRRIASIAYQSLLALLIGSVATTTMEAQYDPGITVRIPFAFTAGGQTMEAGVYVVEQLTGKYLLTFVDMKTGHSSLIAFHPGQQQTGEVHGQLVFLDCDGRNVLSEVQIPGSGMSGKVRDRVHSDSKNCSAGNTTSIAMR